MLEISFVAYIGKQAAGRIRDIFVFIMIVVCGRSKVESREMDTPHPQPERGCGARLVTKSRIIKSSSTSFSQSRSSPLTLSILVEIRSLGS